MSRPAEEMLYLAMEDFRVDVVIGKGPGRHRDPARDPALHAGRRDDPGRPAARPAARPVRLHRPPRVLRARRARADRAPLRGPARRRADRRRRRPRSPPARAARRGSPTGCCAGSATTPRSAPTGSSTLDVAQLALELYEVDESGLDRLDRAVLDVLCRRFGGGPVGISTLAVAVGEERETVEEVAEPFLVRSGLLARTPRGRVATPAAWAHLGLTAPRPDRSGALRRVNRPRERTAWWSLHFTVGRPDLRRHTLPTSARFSSWKELVSLLPIIGIALLFWLLIIRPQSRRQKAVVAMQSALEPGTEVMLSSGVYGRLEQVDDDHVHAADRRRRGPQGRQGRGRQRGRAPGDRARHRASRPRNPEAMASRRRPRRTLLGFFIGLAIAYGLVALAGTWTPTLGLDLQGGTRITLIAEGDPCEDNLVEASQIIDQRVNGSGVSEAEVTTQGNGSSWSRSPARASVTWSTPSSGRPSCGSGSSRARPSTVGAARDGAHGPHRPAGRSARRGRDGRAVPHRLGERLRDARQPRVTRLREQERGQAGRPERRQERTTTLAGTERGADRRAG